MPGIVAGDLVLDTPPVKGKEGTGYPTQKPLALLDRIIKASSNEGDTVFDPFCGCATTLVAADRLQRDWIGIDISPRASDLVVSRIKEDQGIFQSIIARSDIPQRTDLGHIRRYNAPENKNMLYGEQGGDCNGCGEHFQKQHLEIDHIIAEKVPCAFFFSLSSQTAFYRQNCVSPVIFRIPKLLIALFFRSAATPSIE